ncbi:hypothetical protein [Listeria sp. PSOL-1]|uniref:hypothetical protein n=1 Tax=Listeria sp. PSOL-1 TaxID=1844999 RepID=UPI0013D00A12|nr:hypothetical protein [Listeria sp. PSOL-1]
MVNKITFLKDKNHNIKKQILDIVESTAELPNQIFKHKYQYNFYFYDFYKCVNKPFIKELYNIGNLVSQQKFKIYTLNDYYKKSFFFFNKKKQASYANVNINATPEEYEATLEHDIGDNVVDFLSFYYLYWIFSSACLIYGDKASELSILALDKSFQLTPELQGNWLPVEIFVKEYEDMNLDPGIDVKEFQEELIKNYRNVE